MAFGKPRNRRRQDVTHRKDAVKGAVRAHGPSVVKAIVLTVVTAGLVWGGVELRAWALASPRFALTDASFEGLQHATRAELIRLSGLSAGQNLFALDVDALERAMLQHPWVSRVDVTRHFPSAVAVEVREHVPAALAVLGDLYVLDEEGEPFKRVTPGDGLDLPLVTGLTREAYMADPDGTRERFRTALSVARAYEAQGPAKEDRLSEVKVEATSVTLVAVSGQEIRMGEGEAEAKLRRLARIRRELRTRGLAAEIIHLDNRARPGWVAVKLSRPVSERNGVSTR